MPIETPSRTIVDRVLITGDAHQLAQQETIFTNLSPNMGDIALCTSDSIGRAQEKAVPGMEIRLSQNAGSPAIGNILEPAKAAIELERFGIGL